MIQIWLQVYFPELRFPDVVLPEDQVLAQPLMAAEVPKRSIEEYLMFFRHCTKRSAAQWQVVIRRTYPWFQPGYRLFEKEPEEETARTDFRKRFLSVTLPRDLPYGGLARLRIALKVLFNGRDSRAVHAGEETHQFMVQIIKDINARIIEEQSTTSPATEEQAEQPASELVEVPRSPSVLAVVTSPLKPPIVAMPIHSLPCSSATASFADPELAEFEAMDLDA
ncbi:unnamed protein product, partial [Prunus brigantina]